SNPQVSVTVTEDLKFLWFEIWNNGVPFSEEAQVNAQKLFFTEDKGRSGKHYGIGLSFAQAVAVRHGGTMIITNLVNDGVSVKLGIQKF
ncbi:sensor histidine kinase, partial [Lactobacillus salivarius]|nr:sensor histidine kinase [Ligilactobacillus salivarius]